VKRVLAVLVAVAPFVMPAAHAVEDRYDIPGIHDCWGIRTHKNECRGSP
jgi:hypothetical protein